MKLIKLTRMSLVVLLLGNLLAPAVAAETIISPRTKAEHEADMKRLSELYGPKADPRLLEQVKAQQSGQTAQAAESVTAKPAMPTPQPPVAKPASAPLQSAKPAEKIRAELGASGQDRFVFAGKVYSRLELEPVLRDLDQSYALDHIALMSNAEPIQLKHLIELSKLSEVLKKPAMYQDGDQFKAVN
jgi:hypothetical protein